MRLAGTHTLRTTFEVHPVGAANEALRRSRAGELKGPAVLDMGLAEV